MRFYENMSGFNKNCFSLLVRASRLCQSRKKSEIVPQQNPLVETLFIVQLIRYCKKQIPPFGSFRDLRMRSPVFALRMRESEK